MQRERSCLSPTTSGCFLSLAALIIPKEVYSLGRNNLQNPAHAALQLCRDSNCVKLKQ